MSMLITQLIGITQSYYLCHGGYAINPCLSVCPCVSTLFKNFEMDCTKFSLEVGNAPMNKCCKTCLGGGMHCPSASSYIFNTPC